MKRLEVSGAVRPLYVSLGFKGLMYCFNPEDKTLYCRSKFRELFTHESTYTSVDLILHVS